MNIENHPFLEWISGLSVDNSVTPNGKDLILGTRAGKEFAVGIHEEFPLLCYQEEHKKALESVKWSAAALLFNNNAKDWIILSARDIRPKAISNQPALPLRLFFPVTFGRMEPWKEHKPSKLYLGLMHINKKGSPDLSGEPKLSLPLSLIG